MVNDKPSDCRMSPWYQQAKQLSESIDTILQQEEPPVRAEIEQEAQNLFMKSKERREIIKGYIVGGVGTILSAGILYESFSNSQAPTFFDLFLLTQSLVLTGLGIGTVPFHSNIKKLFKAKVYQEKQVVEPAQSYAPAEMPNSGKIPYHKIDLGDLIIPSPSIL